MLHGALLSPVKMYDIAQVKCRALLKCVFATPNDNLFCKNVLIENVYVNADWSGIQPSSGTFILTLKLCP